MGEFTTLESTPTDTMDMPSPRSTAPLLPQFTLDTMAYTMESTTPTLVSTTLASVMPILTPNTSTATEFTTQESTLTDTTDIPSPRSTAPLLPQFTLDTTAYTTEYTTPMLVSTILASVMPILTPQWSTPPNLAGTHIPILLLSAMFTMLVSTDLPPLPCLLTKVVSTLPIQVLTILDTLVTVSLNVKPKLILNGNTTTPILHMPATPDTLDTPDTPLHTTTEMSGTELNTYGKTWIKR